MSVIEEIGAAVAAVATTIGPSIVGIGRNGRGSGIVVADGQVLTNAHNLRGEEVTVTFADGRSTRGTVTGVDPDGDLAVVSVDTSGATPVTWGSGQPVSIGTPVFGAAATYGGGVRVTFGLVSSVSRSFRGPGGRRIAGSIEHSAPMAPGSSGGALVDAGGTLIALNTNRIGEGFYLALPADASLRARIEALGRGESATRPRLGVAIAPNHVARRLRRSVGLPDRAGVLVRGVESGSAAEAAGVEAGDLIVSAGGRPIADADDLQDALGALERPFDLGVVRGADERTLTVAAATASSKPERTPGDA
ncbi:MAG TPA: trypsin-like peptidase domain-containing protein [Candidatus Limnocylindrales bacterium]|nr:trypsin-like peptidase domain-containing protein [Candidatus Limnocylindrales bacterium]